MKKLTLFLAMIFAVIGLAQSGAAQERGQYLPGFRGLNVGEQPPPGFTYANYIFWYPSGKLKDHDGNTANDDIDIDLVADANVFAYTPKKKILGGTYSASVIVPIQNIASDMPNVGATLDTGFGLGDIYVEPLSLNWKLKKGKIRTSYGFMAPTGRYEAGASDNLTTDFWGHQFMLGGTMNPDKKGLWQINASSVWEAHQKKRHADIKVGNNVTFEYGVGRTFVKNQGKRLIQLGLVGYSEFQLTDDTGAGVMPPNLGNKDSVHALGGEFDYILPMKKLNFMLRVLPEYGARSRTQGVTIVAGFGKTF
jgi:hypothetical protein